MHCGIVSRQVKGELDMHPCHRSISSASNAIKTSPSATCCAFAKSVWQIEFLSSLRHFKSTCSHFGVSSARSLKAIGRPYLSGCVVSRFLKRFYVYLARLANFPTGLYILLAIISLYFLNNLTENILASILGGF